MATANTAEIERVVRRVLNAEGDGKATLKAIQRVTTLLTREVIPNLPEKTAGDDGEEPDSISDSISARSAPPEDDPHDDQPEVPGDDQQSADEIPEPVTEAFHELYKTLTPEQAAALASLFKAVSSELGEGGDEDQDAEPDSRYM